MERVDKANPSGANFIILLANKFYFVLPIRGLHGQEVPGLNME